MKKIIFFLFLLLFPSFVFAQSDNTLPDKSFKAKVIEILEERDNILPDGNKVFQQNLKLRGISGEMKGREFNFDGISTFDVVNKNIYKVGDRVIVVASADDQGNISYYITDFVRTESLFWLFVMFIVTLLLIGRGKGLRSLLSLFLTFFIIIKFLVPQALSGGSLLWPTLIVGIVILAIVIYLTEGFNKRSHISMVSTVVSLSLTVFLSWLFVELARLAGLGSEEISHLVNIGDGMINFKGLLLSGIIIGALGVMDDVIISQVASVEQLHNTDNNLSPLDLYKKAMDIGVSHIGSMTNTLFLAYAGASLPLLVLFVSGESAFGGWGEVINNEIIATEIVRTLAGSIGLMMAVPISTYLAVWAFKKDN